MSMIARCWGKSGVGATGNVGREMLNILDEREFPVNEVVARRRGRRRSGIHVLVGDDLLHVRDAAGARDIVEILQDATRARAPPSAPSGFGGYY
jgi:aspartate-semialdehyde dehydrogenase